MSTTRNPNLAGDIAPHIRRIDTQLPMPEYQTDGAVAFDIYSRIETWIPPMELVLVPSNLIIEVPNGYRLKIQSRSSLFERKRLLVVSGLIDQDFCGASDEILIQVLNMNQRQSAHISSGERIAQGYFTTVAIADFIEENAAYFLGRKARGGFGTTD